MESFLWQFLVPTDVLDWRPPRDLTTPLPCWSGCIQFLNDLFYGRSYIAAPAKLSIPVPLDEKSTVVPVRLAGEQSGGKRKVSYGDARSNSERAAPSIALRNESPMRDARWSEAVAVGSLNFVEKMKSEKRGASRSDFLDLSADSVRIQNPKPVLSSNAEGSKIQNWAKLTGDNLTAKMRL